MPQEPKVAFLVALNKVQGTMDAVTKDKQNPHFRSGYASLTAVNETIMPTLSENGFVLLSGGVDILGKTYLRTTLFHVAGHSESFDYPLICADANPQHLASATSYARRYALCAFFNLSTEDDDGNSASQPEPVYKSEPVNFIKNPVQIAPAAITAPVRSVAPVASGEIELATFIPTQVRFVPGKGKGEGKTFSEIFNGNSKYGGDELQGQMAESAKNNRRDIVVAFKTNGSYKNIGRGGVKFADTTAAPVEAEILDAPF